MNGPEAKNLFERLFRYPTKNVHPFENQLTEAFAALFERCEVFRQRTFEAMTGRKPEGNIFIRTQSPYFLTNPSNTKMIDIEIWDAANGKRFGTYFVEVKAWSSENQSFNELSKDDEGQLENYRQILIKRKASLGNHIGLLGITPRLNPLDLLDRKSDGLSVCRNLYWDQVGDLINEVLPNIKSPAEEFLLREFLKYLEGNHVMVSKNVSEKDFEVFGNYLTSKRKFWVALEPINKILKGFKGPKDYVKNFGTASATEENDVFVVYRKFSEKNNLVINSGFSFEESPKTWVGSWIELNPNAGDVRESLLENCLKLKDVVPNSENAIYWDDKWHIYLPERDQWCLCARGADLSRFSKSKSSIEDITRYLADCTKEAYSVLEKSGVVKATK